jgi:2-octaprenyl-6-methoxyphenol hydroxylase
LEKDNLSQIRVIGAGPAGLIFALLTAKKTFQIMLHEKDSEGFFAQQSRALALSPSSIEILSEIGISPDQDSSFIPIKTIHTSQKNSFGRVLIEDDGKELGYVIRYKNLIKLLLDRVKSSVLTISKIFLPTIKVKFISMTSSCFPMVLANF